VALVVAAIAKDPGAALAAARGFLVATCSCISIKADRGDEGAAFAAGTGLRAVTVLRAAWTVVRADLRAKRPLTYRATAHHSEGERLSIRRAAFEWQVIAAHWPGATVRRRAAGAGAGTDVAATVTRGAANLPLVVAAKPASGADGITAARFGWLLVLFLPLLAPLLGQRLFRPLVADERGEHGSSRNGDKASAR
jgi:hypothetical protein